MARIINAISSRETAKQWGLSVQRIQQFLLAGRISGAIKIGRDWLIPSDAARPVARTAGRKKKPQALTLPLP